jgi:O-succinylbenzoate synthase
LKLERIDLQRIRIPLRSPFRTSFGTETERDVLLLHAFSSAAEGWAECVAMSAPLYSSEYVTGASEVMRRFLLPRLAELDDLRAEDVVPALRAIKGHPMAKAALEMVVLDVELRDAGVSFAKRLGAVRDRVPTGVSVGIMNSIPELITAVEDYIAQGYVRIKLKIEPGWDVEPVRAVREHFGDDLMLQVDANTAYDREDFEYLSALDPFNLLLIEQPLSEDDLQGHADLATSVSTPICLDESITSARSAIEAIEMGACSIVNIKPARVGGYLEAVRIHDVCVERSVPVWCGGMLETGIGRAANVALAALPGFTLPGDTSASDRYYLRDVTPPFLLDDGSIAVPTGPGLGVDPLPEALEEFTTSVEQIDF